jgi:hypothetical protein
MPDFIPRSATQRPGKGSPESKLLHDWANLHAYVLLAEPGGGKTCAFEYEASACGGCFVKARSFANIGAPKEWQPGQTLFIDGFDEMQAGASSQDQRLDALIKQLRSLNSPKFRLSCRAADWQPVRDLEALRDVAPEVEALHLNPLTNDEISALLKRNDVTDPAQFQREAELRNLHELLRNPLLMQLLSEVVSTNWPESQRDIYARACEKMVVEHSGEIQEAKACSTPPREQILNDAGLLCAALLLAGLEAWDVRSAEPLAGDEAIQAMPQALNVGNHAHTLSTKLFIAEGGRRIPRHRSVAGYLAAQAIAQRLQQTKLPLSRVLALMSGLDGGIVEPLRELCAWLSVFVTCTTDRHTLIERDPLGCVFYGDVSNFSVADKRCVLQGMQREAERHPWFRNSDWEAHAFGALGTTNMAPAFEKLLRKDNHSEAHQALLGCVLDAMRVGELMPQLMPQLETLVRETRVRTHIRIKALDVWCLQTPDNLAPAKAWLDDIQSGVMDDPDDELCGSLLSHLSCCRTSTQCT